jgi:superfamily II DNA or RNA helicase
MTSRHSASSHFLKNGLFDGLVIFADLEVRISALPGNKERGDAFEIFAEAYFATQKIAQAQEVWPFEAVPLEQRRKLSLDTGRDMGVDGTYLTVDGELRAYQVKFRSRRAALTWEDLSTFMGLTDQVSQRVLFTNSETLPALMQDRSGFVPIRGNDLDRLTAEDFAAMRQWLQTGRVKLPRKQPLPHQQEALIAIAAGLQAHDRATTVMACGTGKSLVSLWAAELYNCKTMLVLVPSLALVRQLLHEWLRETSWEQLTFMCVCSDPTVAKGGDDVIVHQADLDFPVTTDSVVVNRFLNKPFDGVKIVFSTYQSAHVVAAGLPVNADGKAQAFDLAIFDEAHKTASREGSRFSFALEDANLPIRKRLFFTATPRHYDIRKKDKEGDAVLAYSMDRPEVYGPVIHTLSFAEAARRGIICDYKVVISVVTSEMVNDDLLKHGEVLVAGDVVKARQVALQIALQKAVEKYGVSRIFTFHGSVAAARSFTSSESDGIQQHLPEFTTLHVSGEMPTSRREDQMKAFRQADKAVISNARCLTEGVDVPAVDMVAFISPRKSKVDIVQATGRAMRKSPGKEFGYVMVPLFVEQANDESIEEALKRTGFDDVWDLLGAMREQDDVLVDIIRQMQEDKGRTGGCNDSRFSERVEVLGPSVSLETIRESVTAECLESLGVSWDEWLGTLIAFAEHEGHCSIPAGYRTADGRRLGTWVQSQRTTQSTLPTQRRHKLESVKGWIWDVSAEQWRDGFYRLTVFVEFEGNCMVRNDYQTSDGYRLGQWVAKQRAAQYELSDEQKRQLESVQGWVWDVRADQWEVGFRHLTDFVAREKHCQIQANCRAGDDFRLGLWVTNQRATRDGMTVERRERLEGVPGWTWNARDDQWETSLNHLKEFAKREGHICVPRNYRTSDGLFLGAWITTQRTNRNKMAVERKTLLESIPTWLWDVTSGKWETSFDYLAKYVNQEGHTQVPQRYRTSEGHSLGTWVGKQRAAKDDLSIEQRQRLEALPGWVWDTRADQWETGLRYLREFATHEGNCLVPQRYLTGYGYRLGAWVTNQRASREKLSTERKEKLEATPGWLWDVLSNKWETNFHHLAEFACREGHCRVPQDYQTSDGVRLGLWVSTQRASKDTLPGDRRELLESTPGWIWRAKG